MVTDFTNPSNVASARRHLRISTAIAVEAIHRGIRKRLLMRKADTRLRPYLPARTP